MSHEELTTSAVVECRKTEDLSDLLLHRSCVNRACRMTRKDCRLSVHHIGLAEIWRREELHVQSSLTYKLCRYRLVKIYSHLDALLGWCDLDRIVEVILLIDEVHCNGV